MKESIKKFLSLIVIFIIIFSAVNFWPSKFSLGATTKEISVPVFSKYDNKSSLEDYIYTCYKGKNIDGISYTNLNKVTVNNFNSPKIEYKYSYTQVTRENFSTTKLYSGVPWNSESTCKSAITSISDSELQQWGKENFPNAINANYELKVGYVSYARKYFVQVYCSGINQIEVNKTTNWTTTSRDDFARSSSSASQSVKNLQVSQTKYTYKCTMEIGNNNDNSSSNTDTTSSGNGGGSSSSTETGSSSNTETGSSTIYTNQLAKGDFLKFTGNSWNLRTKDRNSIGKYLSQNDIVEIKEIKENNLVQIKIYSGQYKDMTTHIIYGSDASNHFEVTEAIKEVETPTEDEQVTETVNVSEEQKQAIEFLKQLAGNSNMELLYEKLTDTQKSQIDGLVEGKITAVQLTAETLLTSGIISNFTGEDVVENYAKFACQRALGNTNYLTATKLQEYKKLYETYEKDKNIVFSMIIEDITSSSEFAKVCEKYGITKGTYTAQKGYNSNTTEKIVKDYLNSVYSTIKAEAGTEVINSKVDELTKSLVNGKITASTAIKTIVESDEFKNLKLTDEEYIDIISKICLNKELDATTKTEYENRLINGTTRNGLLQEVLLSTEFKNTCNKLGLTPGTATLGAITSTDELVTEFTQNVHNATLGETVTYDAGTYGASNLINGEYSASDVIQSYVESDEFANKVTNENMTNSDYIKCIFKACLQRSTEPSSSEINNYEKQLDSTNKSKILQKFFELDEYKKLCNTYYLKAGKYIENSSIEIVENRGLAKITFNEKTLSSGEVVRTVKKVTFATGDEIEKGDVNGDGDINASDASLILIYVSIMQLNYEKPTNDMLAIGDANEDGMIDSLDASYVLKFSSKRAVASKGTSNNDIWEEIKTEIEQ